MKITVINGEIPLREKNHIIEELQKKHPDRIINEIRVEISGEYLNVNYSFSTPEFERIRRITGYLVGTLDRFNNAKRAEVQDRVKHGLSEAVNLEDIE